MENNRVEGLLLKDLCSRLPYGVKVKYRGTVATLECIWSNGKCVLLDKDDRHLPFLEDRVFIPIEEVKPYLFPLSSMTEEQKEEHKDLLDNQYSFDANGNIFTLQDFYCKCHLDVNGLIGKGLAIDATGLNIY